MNPNALRNISYNDLITAQLGFANAGDAASLDLITAELAFRKKRILLIALAGGAAWYFLK